MNIDLTPTERLILISLAQNPNQSAKQLTESTGTKTHKYLLRSLRTLCIAKMVVLNTNMGDQPTYSVVGQ